MPAERVRYRPRSGLTTLATRFSAWKDHHNLARVAERRPINIRCRPRSGPTTLATRFSAWKDAATTTESRSDDPSPLDLLAEPFYCLVAIFSEALCQLPP
jgi:hypothetical protein